MKTPFDKKHRVLWYMSVDKDNRSVTQTCQIFGISRKTYYKWRKRDFFGGGGLSYKKHKPPSNTKPTHEVCQFIESEKRKINYGPLKMKLPAERGWGIILSTTVIYRF